MRPVCLYYCQEEDAITFPSGAQVLDSKREEEGKGKKKKNTCRGKKKIWHYVPEVWWLSGEQIWTLCGCFYCLHTPGLQGKVIAQLDKELIKTDCVCEFLLCPLQL